MSAVGGAGGGGAGGAGGGGGGGPNWSQGHGVDSVAGEKGLKKYRTPLYQSGAASVAENWAARVPVGSSQQGYGKIDISLVPSRSNRAEFRAVATKQGGGGAGGATSFPMGRDPVALALSGGRAIIDRPDSPPPPVAAAVFAPPVQGPPPAAAAAAFVPPVQGPPPAVPAPVFMPPVAGPAQGAPPPAAFAPLPVPARAAAAAPMPAVKGPPRGGGGSAGGSGKQQ